MGRLAQRLGVVAAVLAAGTVVAAPAYADVLAQAYLSAGRLTFVDRPGAYDLSLFVNTLGNAVVFDAQYPISPLAGCAYISAADPTRVSCTGAITSLVVHGDDGNDLIYVGLTGVYSTLRDVAYGDAGDDQLYGGPSVSTLYGGPGDDALYGQGDNDNLIGGPGADRLYGGDGADFVEYSDHSAGAHISLDGVLGDDGMPGEGDTIGSDVEHAEGTAFADVIIGNAADNRLFGLGGADEIRGLGGDDALCDVDGIGGRPLAADILDGGPGNDWVMYNYRPTGVIVSLDNAYGNDGAPGEGDSVLNIEYVFGTDGNDIIVGDANANAIYGGGGDDYILGQGGDDYLIGDAGADHIDGGDGSDHCDLGTDGLVMTNCEH